MVRGGLVRELREKAERRVERPEDPGLVVRHEGGREVAPEIGVDPPFGVPTFIPGIVVRPVNGAFVPLERRKGLSLEIPVDALQGDPILAPKASLYRPEIMKITVVRQIGKLGNGRKSEEVSPQDDVLVEASGEKKPALLVMRLAHLFGVSGRA